MQKSVLRIIIGGFIGGFAGISLVTAITPLMLTSILNLDMMYTIIVVRSFGLPIALIWVIGGALLGWQGGAFFGAATLGACGAVSGLLIGTLALSGGGTIPLFTTITGLLYGGIGGLIIGKAFYPPTQEV